MASRFYYELAFRHCTKDRFPFRVVCEVLRADSMKITALSKKSGKYLPTDVSEEQTAFVSRVEDACTAQMRAPCSSETSIHITRQHDITSQTAIIQIFMLIEES
jgi:hypothetical protein